jgi:hypothetical protein
MKEFKTVEQSMVEQVHLLMPAPHQWEWQTFWRTASGVD